MPRTKEALALDASRLRRTVAPEEVPFDSTKEAPCLSGIVGQKRAIDSIQFGLQVRALGYSMYISGQHGSGRETAVKDFVEKFASEQKTPPDWIYAYNFENTDAPITIQLPAGRGSEFVKDMEEFIRTTQRQIPRAFEGEDYDQRRRETISNLNQKRGNFLEELSKFSKDNDFSIEVTPTGFMTVPLANGTPLSADVFEELSQEKKEEYKTKNMKIQEAIGNALRQIRNLEKEVQEQLKKLDQDITEFTVGPLLDEISAKYADQEQVQNYLAQVRKNLLQHTNDFRPVSDAERSPMIAMQPKTEDPFARYRLNLIIDNKTTKGAPVVFERNPTYYHLLGRINYRPTFGAMVTDFSQVKAGALHKANGGFLIVHMLDVLKNPLAWDALKRSLLNREIRTENMGEHYTMLPTATLRPDPIPLDIKVILIGPPQVYQILHHFDEDFERLFKVKVDFATDMPLDADNIRNYSCFISRCVKDNGLKHFEKRAIGKIIEHGARLADYQDKLSTKLIDIADVVTESSFWADKSGRTQVTVADVERAIRQKDYRSNLIEERVQELINNNTIMIDTDGEKIGQVNGLAIASVGDYAFGKPSRITASVSLGKGTLTSIEREIKLSGPIHSKGFLILSGYLTSKYAQQAPLALAATITFEQSYDEVDGDSASSTELYVILSALAGIPIKQGIAVTGSVNQKGEIQAVGGVTRKIEGFYAVCKAKGLDGQQGVIIPASNVKNLMLNEEIVRAVEDKKFHVWAVKSIDEGIEILSDMPAGKIAEDGRYAEASVHRRAADRIAWYAEQIKAFVAHPEEGAATRAIKEVA